MELTSEADSLWKQTTTCYDTVNTNSYMENAKLLPDGGLIGAGWADLAISPGQQMWLIKTDSMGCDGTEWTCDVTYLEEQASKQESGLLVYPNPVRENLHISLNNSELIKNEKLKIKNEIASVSPRKDANNNSNCEQSEAISLTIEQFNSLTIEKKLKYSSKNPNNKLWGKKEEQEMRELSHKYAIAFPFEVIKGKQDIFAIEPALAVQVQAKSNKLKVESNSMLMPE